MGDILKLLNDHLGWLVPSDDGFPALPVVVAVFLLFGLGYFWYARFLARRVLGVEDDRSATPAHALRDDHDYVPTKRSILFGHHFTSVAGAAPIVGPAIGVIWGWLPAVLWVALGAVFMGAAQDMAALAVSARNRGRSLGDLAGGIVSNRARLLFLLIVLFAAWIVLAVFALVIAILFADYPLSVLPINIEILVAVGIGYAVYRLGWPATALSLAAVAFLYAMIVFCAGHQPGTYQPHNWPLLNRWAESRWSATIEHDAAIQGEKAAAEFRRDLRRTERREPTLGEHRAAYAAAARAERDALANDAAARRKAMRNFDVLFWLGFLFLYSYVASVLPVWTLLQPRDYINSHQLFIALGLVYMGFLIARPAFAAPAIRLDVPFGRPGGTTPPIFPFLFITIACGAISGFHSLVSSGTTSKQLDRFKDVRPIGYGAMLGEASLGLLAILACTTGLTADEWWTRYYASYSGMDSLGSKMTAFVNGGGNLLAALLSKVGLDAATAASIAQLVLVVMVVSFAATTLDTATRIQRYVVSELGEAVGAKFLSGRHAATGVAVGSAFLLATAKPGGAGGMALWPLFGALNQLIACLALMVISVYLWRSRKPARYYMVPMAIVGSIVMIGLWQDLKLYLFDPVRPHDYLLGSITAAIMLLTGWLTLEALAALRSPRSRTLPFGFR